MRTAVIDVGSNSVLLLVAEWNGGEWVAVHEASEITALGQGTRSTGRLGEPGMSDTLRAIQTQFEAAKAHGVSQPVAAATMAVRMAENQSEFIARAEAQGTPIQVLSGQDEAELGFEAVVTDPAFAHHSVISIIDPGGHSTELTIGRRDGERWRRDYLQSFPIGALGLTSEVMPSETPSGPEILTTLARIDHEIDAAKGHDAGQVVVLGATGTNLASIALGLPTWQPQRVHGFELDFEFISNAVGLMMAMSNAERRAIIGIEPGRERTLHIGALILERFLQVLGVESCLVSVRGWRHALLERMGTQVS